MHIEMLRNLVTRAGKNNPHKTAYICGDNSITWQEIDERFSKAALFYSSWAISPGRLWVLSRLKL